MQRKTKIAIFDVAYARLASPQRKKGALGAKPIFVIETGRKGGGLVKLARSRTEIEAPTF